MSESDNEDKPQGVPARLKGAIKGWGQKKMLLGAVALVAMAAVYMNVGHKSQQVASKSAVSAAPIIQPVKGKNAITPEYANSLKRSDDKVYEAAKKTVTTGEPVSAMPSVIDTPETEKLPTSLDDLDDADSGGIKRPAKPDIPSIQDDTMAGHPMPHAGLGEAQPQPVRVNTVAPPSEEQVSAQKLRVQNILSMNRFNPALLYSTKEVAQTSGSSASLARNTMRAGTAASYGSKGEGNGSASADDSFSYVAPDPGTVVSARLIGEVDSRASGSPVLATVTSGPYSGARIMGGFSALDDGLVMKFTSMTVPYEDDYGNEKTKSVTINAVAVSRDKLSTLMATSVDHHLWSKVGIQLATSFMQGLGQAIQQSGSTAMVSSGSGSFISSGQKNLTQEMLQAGGTSAGSVGQQFQSIYGNEPTTILVAKDTEFGLLFLGQGN